MFAEREMGQRVAHSFALSDVVEYLDVAPRFGIVKVRPPQRWVGRRLDDVGESLTPVALRRGDAVTVNPSRDEVIQAGDEVILIGQGRPDRAAARRSGQRTGLAGAVLAIREPSRRAKLDTCRLHVCEPWL